MSPSTPEVFSPETVKHEIALCLEEYKAVRAEIGLNLGNYVAEVLSPRLQAAIGSAGSNGPRIAPPFAWEHLQQLRAVKDESPIAHQALAFTSRSATGMTMAR